MSEKEKGCDKVFSNELGSFVCGVFHLKEQQLCPSCSNHSPNEELDKEPEEIKNLCHNTSGSDILLNEKTLSDFQGHIKEGRFCDCEEYKNKHWILPIVNVSKFIKDMFAKEWGIITKDGTNYITLDELDEFFMKIKKTAGKEIMQ